MKILIAGAPSKFFHLKEFGEALNHNGAEYKLVDEIEYVVGFPDKRITNWFPSLKKFHSLLKEFKPDIIFCDRPAHFAYHAIKNKIPLQIHLRGDIWKEFQWARKTNYTSLKIRFALWYKERLAERCFKASSKILPISKYLEKIVKNRYPTKDVEVLYGGIDSSRWYPVAPMELKHPCVGLLQGAVIWGKTIEVLTLKKTIEEMPKVTFYWAGDGEYKNIILDSLGKYENFKWLGGLKYPEDVRRYLSGIDIYALVSGIDQSPLTLQEAALMEKPTIATNAGGIPELMIDNRTGFLVKKGEPNDLLEKVSILLDDEKKREMMGKEGRKNVIDNFNWDKIAKRYLLTLK